MKAVAYLRTACVGQDTPVPGREAVQAYADALGLELIGWYTDAGVNGRGTLAERPAGVALLEAAERREFAVVLVASLDRIGRRAAVVTGAIQRLAAAGVKVESIAAGEMR